MACRRMSATTFSDPRVKKLIDEHFVMIEINVDHEKAAAAWFRGEGIPDTCILGLNEEILDRVVGFEEPGAFAARLRKAVEARQK